MEKRKNWVNEPTKTQMILTVSAFLVALILIVAVGTDFFKSPFDFDRSFVLALLMVSNFLLVVRVVVNYLKTKNVNNS